MTITLQLNRTYRTRDGSAEHTINDIRDVRNSPNRLAWAGGLSWWAHTGRRYNPIQLPTDLVEEVTAQPAGPVRQSTITEIVPGNYGFVYVSEPRAGHVHLELTSPVFNADELAALAQTATQLAATLRQIKSEKQS